MDLDRPQEVSNRVFQKLDGIKIERITQDQDDNVEITFKSTMNMNRLIEIGKQIKEDQANEELR